MPLKQNSPLCVMKRHLHEKTDVALSFTSFMSHSSVNTKTDNQVLVFFSPNQNKFDKIYS